MKSRITEHEIQIVHTSSIDLKRLCLHVGLIIGSLEVGLDAFGELRVFRVHLDDNLTKVAVLILGEFRVAAEQIGFEIRPTDPVTVFDIENYGFYQTSVLLHRAMVGCRFLWASECHGFEPDEGFVGGRRGDEGFAAAVEEEGVGAVSEWLVGVVVDGSVDIDGGDEEKQREEERMMGVSVKPHQNITVAATNTTVVTVKWV